MAAATPRLALWLFGSGFTAAVALVVIAATSMLTGALSSALMMQLFDGGEIPPTPLDGAVILIVGVAFLALGVLLVFAFN